MVWMREQWTTAHPGEYLTEHLDKFLTGLPCVLLQPIHLNFLLGINAIFTGFPCLLLQPIQVNLLMCIREFLTDLPFVILQPIQVNLLLGIDAILTEFHVYFYSTSENFSLTPMCNFTAHPGESFLCIVTFLLAFHLCYYSTSTSN